MILAFGDVSAAPKTNICYLWRHQNTQQNPRKNQMHIIAETLKILDIEQIGILEKTSAEQS